MSPPGNNHDCYRTWEQASSSFSFSFFFLAEGQPPGGGCLGSQAPGRGDALGQAPIVSLIFGPHAAIGHAAIGGYR